jgi:DNA-binding transcriptional ArsR family regulator
MAMDDTLRALANPTRRAMLQLVWDAERSSSEIAAAVGATRPATSQHLKVLRDAGLVHVRVNAQQRIYELNPEGLMELYAWVAKYQALWPDTLDQLERYLDARAHAKRGKRR